MTHQPFGKTGPSVSPLGFGGAPIGYLQTDRERVGKVLNLLLDSGVNLIDTAASYKGSEEAIAETIGKRRGEFVLVSKCGGALDDIDEPAWTPGLITRTVDRSLKRLKTDRLDVMLLHSCGRDVLERGDCLAALVKAREAGKIRHAGYSGDNDTAAYAASLPDVAVIQTSVNIVDQANIDAVLPACRQRNVGVMAKRPVANAAWKDLGDQPGMYQDYAKTYTERFGAMELSTGDLGFSGPAEQAWPEIALRFTLSQPGLHTAIIGTTNPENARKNIEYARKGPLPPDVVQTIRQAFARANSSGEWTGQT